MSTMTEKYRGQISLANLTIKEMMELAHINVGEALEMYYYSKYMLAIADEKLIIGSYRIRIKPEIF